jgi:hypothetical protein
MSSKAIQRVILIFQDLEALTRSARVRISVNEMMTGFEVCVSKDAHGCAQPTIALAQLHQMGLPLDDQVLHNLLEDTGVIHASAVDIDNDGHKDMRLYITAGTAHCTYSSFFTRTREGQFHPISAPSYQVLREEARLCGGDVSFIRYKGTVFTLEVYDTIATVWQGTKAELRELCRFSGRPR